MKTFFQLTELLFLRSNLMAIETTNNFFKSEMQTFGNKDLARA